MPLEYSLAFGEIIGLTHCIYYYWSLNVSPVNWGLVQATHRKGTFFYYYHSLKTAIHHESLEADQDHAFTYTMKIS